MSVLFGLLSLFVAVVCLGVGVRGRRLDHHPLCRHCHYDFHRLPTKPEVCPECGFRLTLRKHFVIGNRRRRRPLLIAGVLLLLLSAGLFASQYVGIPLRYQPTWWLSWQVRSAWSDLDRVSAGRELTDRLKSGSVSTGTLDPLVDILLVRQRAQPRAHFYADVMNLETLLLAGAGTPADLERYVRNAVQLDLEVEGRARVGRKLSVSLRYRAEKAALPSNLMLPVHLDHLVIDGTRVPIEPLGTEAAGTPGAFLLLDLNAPRFINGQTHFISLPVTKPGVYEVEFPFRAVDPRLPDGGIILPVTRTIRVDPAAPIDDQSLGPRIRASIRHPDRARMHNAFPLDELPRFAGLPAPVSFELVWRVNGEEVVVGLVVADQGSTITRRADTVLPSAAAAPVITPVLRFTPEGAALAPGAATFWEGDIILDARPHPDLPLQGAVMVADVFRSEWVGSGRGDSGAFSSFTISAGPLPVAGAWRLVRADGVELARLGADRGRAIAPVVVRVDVTGVEAGEQVELMLVPAPELADELGVTEPLTFTEPVPLLIEVR